MRSGRNNKTNSRRGYHHGNLKEALVDAARQLIVEKGPHGFSLVEAARIATVSPAAPYRHFDNRNALLAEVARRGFERFTASMERAWQDGTPDPVMALHRMCRVYLEFARKDRSYYSAMFEAGLKAADHPEMAAAGLQARQSLLNATTRIVDELEGSGNLSPELLFSHIWAISHGVATLFGESVGVGDLTGREYQQHLLESGLSSYLAGLGITT